MEGVAGYFWSYRMGMTDGGAAAPEQMVLLVAEVKTGTKLLSPLWFLQTLLWAFPVTECCKAPVFSSDFRDARRGRGAPWQDKVFCHKVDVRCGAPGATSAPATFPGLRVTQVGRNDFKVAVKGWSAPFWLEALIWSHCAWSDDSWKQQRRHNYLCSSVRRADQSDL